ncbi:MAG TPA: hypothetical protein VI298_03845 [Geobacteraceae bacterium]
MTETHLKQTVSCPECGSSDVKIKKEEKSISSLVLGLFAFVLDLFTPGGRSITLEHWNSTKSGYMCQKCGFVFREKK